MVHWFKSRKSRFFFLVFPLEFSSNKFSYYSSHWKDQLSKHISKILYIFSLIIRVAVSMYITQFLQIFDCRQIIKNIFVVMNNQHFFFLFTFDNIDLCMAMLCYMLNILSKICDSFGWEEKICHSLELILLQRLLKVN